MGDIKSAGDSRDDIKKKYAEVYPDATAGSVATCVGMLYRFVYEVQVKVQARSSWSLQNGDIANRFNPIGLFRVLQALFVLHL